MEMVCEVYSVQYAEARVRRETTICIVDGVLGTFAVPASDVITRTRKKVWYIWKREGLAFELKDVVVDNSLGYPVYMICVGGRWARVKGLEIEESVNDEKEASPRHERGPPSSSSSASLTR